MNIINKQQLAEIKFDTVRITEVGGYRRFDVTKDGIPTTYYYPTHEERVTTIEATEGTITTRTIDNPLEAAALDQMLENGEIIPVSLLQQSLDVPDFMKRRQAQMQAQLPPAPIKRTPNQERTFAWWLNEAMKGGDYIE